MIDYAKLELPAEVGARLLQHPELSFRRPVDEQTGEVNSTDKRCADHNGLTFTYYPSGRTTLHGSFHKYAQGGKNCGDYTFTQFRTTIAEVCATFNLDPETSRLLQLEAGANVIPPIRTARTLQAIVHHRDGLAFSKMRSRDGRSLGLDLYRDQFGIKVYDKGRQYGLPNDLLRFEVKFTKGAPLHRMNIYTLNDLLNVHAWQRLQDRVMGIYDELFIAEPSIDLSSLTTSQRTFVTVAASPGYWHGLTRAKRHKDRARYADIVERFAGNDLKDRLRTGLLDKLTNLLNVPSLTVEKGDGFTDTPGGITTGKGRRFHGSVNVGIRHPATAGNSSKVEVVPTTNKQRANNGGTTVVRCLTCGRDITDQRRGSRYCSEARYGKAAKRCRNAGSNPTHSRSRSLERIEREPLLFDHRPYIAPLTTGKYGKITATHGCSSK